MAARLEGWTGGWTRDWTRDWTGRWTGRWRQIGGMLAVLMALCAASAAAQVAAQDASPAKSAILTIDQDALFERTLYGQAVRAAAEQEAEALKVENRAIDAALEAEERSLTDRRAGMPLPEFRALADAFDTKVEALRTAQDAKFDAYIARRDSAQQQFFQTVAPMIGDYMVTLGASAIINQAAIVVSLGAIDITDEVIAQIDAKLGDGSTLAPTTPPAPAPAPAPATP